MSGRLLGGGLGNRLRGEKDSAESEHRSSKFQTHVVFPFRHEFAAPWAYQRMMDDLTLVLITREMR